MRIVPELHKKNWVIGSIGTLIGAGIGAYISVLKGSYIYAGIGAVAGGVLAEIIGFFVLRKRPSLVVGRAEKSMDLFIGVLSLLLALGGIAAFMSTGKLVGIAGTIFFGLCGLYLLKYKK